MDDNLYPPEEAPPPHISVDRHLTIGDTQYLITATGRNDRRIDLAVVACDRDGRVVSELSGGISPADLPAVADVLTSTLAGLVALHPEHRVAPAPARRARRPNHGVRWTEDDDARLIERHRAGVAEKDLMEEFGRSRGGIRLRLEHLGVVPAGGAPAAA